MKAKHIMSYLLFWYSNCLEILIWLISSASFKEVKQQSTFNNDYSEIRGEFDPTSLNLEN